VNLVPSFGKYKVYIIDEVHMLTNAAFNALLKTLEEPPSHIIFILATTEPHKIPATILSRCQRFDFKKIGVNDIKRRLLFICNKENINIDEEAIDLIARLSDGGMRDSVSLLDQLTSYTLDKISVQDVHDVYGTITNDEIYLLLDTIYSDNIIGAFDLIEKYDDSGKNLTKIIESIINFLKNLLIYYNVSSYFKDESQKQMYDNLCKKIDESRIYEFIDILLNTINSAKNTNNVKLLFELCIIKMLDKNDNIISQNISQKNIQVIEDKKELQSKKEEIKIESDENTQKQISNLKKIRINNTLANFSKKELISFKSEMDEIKVLLMNPDYSAKASLILDGELKAKGDKNLIFVYKSNNLEEYFNSSLEEIEKIFDLTFGILYKPIAVSIDEWEIIKEEFNKNMRENNKVYIYQEEVEMKKKEENVSSKNKIEEMFENIIEYN